MKEIQGGYEVALLGPENKAIIRQVKAGEKVGTMWVIEDGLKPGDQVIVEGIGKVKDGTPVVPKTVNIQQGEGAVAMSDFFIRRPIVAIVISVLMVIIGAITIITLPVAQFPDIAPPEIRLQAIYPGADAETMEKAVATPIEQQINGVDNMDYMYSLNSTNNSSSTLLVDFDLKTDPNMDLILAQSRQQLANGQLPPEVNQIGIDVKKSLTSPMMLIALYSPKGTHDAKFLSNYGYINLKEPICARLTA